MKNPTLILPDVRFEESFLHALAEYHEESRFLEHKEEEIAGNFLAFVEKEKSKARGENLPEGFVPETEYWLVDGDEYIGGLSIRHRLSDHLREIGGHIGYSIRPSKRKQGYGKLILKLGIEKAKEMGFEKVLLTCDVTNDGSRKIIEGNGGVLENVVPHEGNPDKARFWIDLQEPRG
jgi:predicted acetyltransferase